MKGFIGSGFVLLSTAFVLFTGCITGSKNLDPVLSVSSPNTIPSPSLKQANPFYNGRGGRGTSLAILAPQVTGFTENLNYLPTLVQGELVSNFSGYSAMSVLDRENLDKLFAETLSGYYKDDAEGVISLGHMTNTDYIMSGTITKTSSGYALQIQIASSEDGMTKASYSGTCTIVELDNFIGIRRASLDLLAKMGVELTDRTKAELAGSAAVNHVNAQTALAQGITAQRSGTVVEALTYYYEAREYDSGLLEASSRLNVLANTITSGNIGENVRNDIQRRNQWLKILTECEVFFKEHLPYEIIYNPDITQGRIDYAKETVDLSFQMELRPTDSFKVVQNILDGLKTTGKQKEWGLVWWPLNSSVFAGVSKDEFGRPRNALTDNPHYADGWGSKIVNVVAAIINENGKTLAETNTKLQIETGFYSPPGMWTDRNYGGVRDYSRIYVGSPRSVSVVFKNVDANDITDNLTIKIVSVDGIDTEIASRNGYIKISMKN
jgi:TolB-like protein